MLKGLLPFFWLFKSEIKVAVYVWATFVAMIAGLKAIPSIFLIMESLTAMFLIAHTVYVYNDIFDVELDRLSAKAGESHYISRPLINGKASKLHAEILILIQTVIGLGIGFFINLQVFALLALYLALGILYSTPPIKLKGRFIFKQLTIASGVGINSLVGGAAVGIISNAVVYIAALFFVLTLFGAPIIDIRDIYADEKLGRKTLPIVIGSKATAVVAMISTVAILIFSILTYSWIGFNFAFAILISASFLILLFSIFNIYKHLNNPNYIEGIVKYAIRPIFLLLQISVLVGIISFK